MSEKKSDPRVTALRERVATLDPRWYYRITDTRTKQTISEGPVAQYVDSILSLAPPDSFPTTWSIRWSKQP